jgi:hypothetical protein
MININDKKYDYKPKRTFEKKTPKYQIIALEVIIWMRDNGVEYKTTDFYDKGYLIDGVEYSAKELFDKFMKGIWDE